MIWLYGYLGIGALVFVAVLGAHILAKGDESESVQRLLDSMDPDRERLFYRILVDYIVPLIAGIAVVVVWPLAVYWRVKEVLEKQPERAAAKEHQGEFSVRRAHLKERLSVESIEARERVTDPLDAVPALPFGHLNAAWKAFLQDAGPDAAIWFYSTHWMRWGTKELREGYVIVRGEDPGSFFQTVWKDLEDEADAGPTQSADPV